LGTKEEKRGDGEREGTGMGPVVYIAGQKEDPNETMIPPGHRKRNSSKELGNPSKLRGERENSKAPKKFL